MGTQFLKLVLYIFIQIEIFVKKLYVYSKLYAIAHFFLYIYVTAVKQRMSLNTENFVETIIEEKKT